MLLASCRASSPIESQGVFVVSLIMTRVSVVGQLEHARSGFSDAEAPFAYVRISDSFRGRWELSTTLWRKKKRLEVRESSFML